MSRFDPNDKKPESGTRADRADWRVVLEYRRPVDGQIARFADVRSFATKAEAVEHRDALEQIPLPAGAYDVFITGHYLEGRQHADPRPIQPQLADVRSLLDHAKQATEKARAAHVAAIKPTPTIPPLRAPEPDVEVAR